MTYGVLLIVLGGFLLGGTYSFQKQGLPKPVVIGMGLAGLLALAAGILWSIS
ncbi:MAG TPA: hypothetical protein VE132_02595 [Micromonosporaceae bacterium]|nr:hypothetical protein [Micromonosporaceae bacterium]